jgi:hypothetical protein
LNISQWTKKCDKAKGCERRWAFSNNVNRSSYDS